MKPLFLLLAAAVVTAPFATYAAQPELPRDGASPAKPKAPAEASAPGGIDRSQPPKAGPLPPVTLPDALTETLPNGMRVYVLADHRQPTVTYRLLIKSGELFDGSHPGLAALTADLLNKGTETLSAEEFAKKTDFLGVSVEASASDDAIAVTASGLSKYTSELLGFLRDAVLNPAFRQGEVDKEKVKTISELAQKKANPSDQATRLRNKLLFGAHPYGAFATPESVKAINRDQLAKFHRTEFVANNATLVIVGDVDPKEALAKAKEAFGDWKKGEIAKPDLPAFPEIKGITFHLVDRPASVQSNILVAGRGVPRDNPDVPELQVVNSVLGGGFSGRLFSNLREKHGYTYGAYSGFSAKKLGGAFSATAQVRNEVTGPAITEIFNELNRLTAEPIPDPELNLQRNYLAGNYLISLESDRRIAERMQEIDLYGLPEDYWKNYAKRLVSVTPEKAAELAKKYVDPKNLVVVVVGKAEEVLPQLEKLGLVTVYDTDLKPLPEKAK